MHNHGYGTGIIIMLYEGKYLEMTCQRNYVTKLVLTIRYDKGKLVDTVHLHVRSTFPPPIRCTVKYSYLDFIPPFVEGVCVAVLPSGCIATPKGVLHNITKSYLSSFMTAYSDAILHSNFVR